MDAYTRQARLMPSLIVATPLILVPFVWPVDGEWGWKSLAAALTACGALALLARLGAYLGKRKERTLFDHFGGRPTETILSHDSGKTNPHTLARWHGALEHLTGVHMPTKEEEASDPYAAMQAYEAGVRLLRSRTRDEKKYPLVAATNQDYGFCRNTWAMKWLALPIALAVGLGTSVKLYLDGIAHDRIAATSAAVVLVTTLLVAFWIWVNKKWVWQAAERYAYALLETLDRPDN